MMGQLSLVLRSLEDHGLMYWCQGCEQPHSVYYGTGGGPRWEWDGNVSLPTFHPSVRVRWNENGVPKCCHTFIKAGMVQFLSDCTHQYAGQTLPLPPLPEHLRG